MSGAAATTLAQTAGWTAMRPGTSELAIDRLRRRPEFLAAARRGRKVAMRSLVLQARKRDDVRSDNADNDSTVTVSCAQESGTGPRIGFTVTRKVGNAVERNRVRRRLREAVRLKAGPLVKAGYDYVVIGRRAALATPFAKIASDLETAIRRIHETAPGRA